MPMTKFRVGATKHYRQGRYYDEGEVVSIDTDKEKPCPDWVKLVSRPKVELVEEVLEPEDDGEEVQDELPPAPVKTAEQKALEGKAKHEAAKAERAAAQKAAEEKKSERPADKSVL